MKRLWVVLMAMVLTAPLACLAADVPMGWDAVGNADQYRIEKSIDLGATWTVEGTVAAPTIIYTAIGVEEDILVLFRVAALAGTAEAIRTWSGAWYDHRLVPPEPPAGMGIQ